MIPVSTKDLDNLETAVDQLRTNCQNPIDKIHIVGAQALRDQTVFGDAEQDGVHWLNDEDIHPNHAEIAEMLAEIGYAKGNESWYFQKVTKLGADQNLDTAARYVLEIDADFSFVEPTTFVDEAGKVQLAYGYPFTWNPGVADHSIPESHAAMNAARRLLPGWQPVDGFSGMQHHMVFDRNVLEMLRADVEEAHGKPFWPAFFGNIERHKWAGISEFVLYRHYVLANAPDKVASRHINAVDIIGPDQDAAYDLRDAVQAPKNADVQAVGCHRFLGYRERLQTMDYIPDDQRARLVSTLGPLALHLSQGVIHINELDPATMPRDKLDLRFASA